MPILQMQTDAVRQAGSDLSRAAQMLHDTGSRVSNAVRALDWTGPGSDGFRNDISRVSSRLQELAEAADHLGYRLRQEAEEWERVAASIPGGTRGSVLGVSFGGSPQAGGGQTNTNSDPGSRPDDIDSEKLSAELQALLSTAGLVTENTFLKFVNLIGGSIDFFALKMPAAEKAFREWEQYNNNITGYDPAVARQLQENARQQLDNLGLGTFKDALSLVTDQLGSNAVIDQAVVKLKDYVYTATDWLEVLKHQ